MKRRKPAAMATTAAPPVPTVALAGGHGAFRDALRRCHAACLAIAADPATAPPGAVTYALSCGAAVVDGWGYAFDDRDLADPGRSLIHAAGRAASAGVAAGLATSAELVALGLVERVAMTPSHDAGLHGAASRTPDGPWGPAFAAGKVALDAVASSRIVDADATWTVVEAIGMRTLGERWLPVGGMDLSDVLWSRPELVMSIVSHGEMGTDAWSALPASHVIRGFGSAWHGWRSDGGRDPTIAMFLPSALGDPDRMRSMLDAGARAGTGPWERIVDTAASACLAARHPAAGVVADAMADRAGTLGTPSLGEATEGIPPADATAWLPARAALIGRGMATDDAAVAEHALDAWCRFTGVPAPPHADRAAWGATIADLLCHLPPRHRSGLVAAMTQAERDAIVAGIDPGRRGAMGLLAAMSAAHGDG